MNACSLPIAAATALLLGEVAAASEGVPAREIRFKLTYAHRDLIWVGDPLSPASHVYPQAGARPRAADVEIRTRVECRRTPYRRYLYESRISADAPRRVYAFTRAAELCVGVLDGRGRFAPNESYVAHRDRLPTWPEDASRLKFDPAADRLFIEQEVPGPTVAESSDFLPLALRDSRGQEVSGVYSIECTPAGDADQPIEATLRIAGGGEPLVLGRAQIPRVLRRADVRLGSFDAGRGAYLPEAAYRSYDPASQGVDPSVTFEVLGEFAPAVDPQAATLSLRAPFSGSTAAPPPSIVIDGRFEDWRNVAGVDDPRGDLVPYLDYVPDVDLLEFKVASDDEQIYLYCRVAGQVGRCQPRGGRSYFYAYMDVDRNPLTGFLPTRDDNCYFGVDLGDDCEVQFEFVNNRLRKSFYGFCGRGGDDDVLRRQVTLGPSQYGRLNPDGTPREHYKSEYTFRGGMTQITEDLQQGTSDTIRVALSPDGSEVEIASTYAGFLHDRQGRPTLQPGQLIDLAAGMECDSKAYPEKSQWGADSTPPIRGHRLGRRN